MDKPLRFGLIGAGGVGAYHLAALRRLEGFGEVQVAGIAETSPKVRSSLSQEGLINGDTAWFSHYEELLDGGRDLDAVAIATPIPFHYEMALAAVERGLHVHLEKPPVPLVQQLNHLLAEDKERKISVGFQLITSRCMRMLKKLIVEETLGTVRTIRAAGIWPRLDQYYSRAVWAGSLVLDDRPVFDGPATNALAHVVHNIMHLASSDLNGYECPVEVEGELYRARPIESYDSACLRGVFPNGIVFSLAVSHACKTTMPFQIRVEGDRGWALLSEDGDKLETSDGLVVHRPETTQDLIHRCYDRLILRLQQKGARAATRLVDTIPYVRTTNGLILSSGGIHDIPRDVVEVYGKDGGRGYDVRGMMSAVKTAFESGRLFSEMDLPWAVGCGKPVRLDSFQEVNLLDPRFAACTANLAVG